MSEGTVVTFYSYKGGVGRTFALANIGALLSLWGYKTLCIDWDLEAPGLHLYFKQWFKEANLPGLTEMIQAYAEGKEPRWQDFVTEVNFSGSPQPLQLMKAGLQDKTYVQRLQALDWDTLYSDHDLGNFLEEIRENWKRFFDFVLIDSRTGITDIGGICTIQLPDILMLMLTASDQSLYGSLEVLERIQETRARLPFDRAKLLVAPVVSRFERRVEYDVANQWLARFADVFPPLYNDWAHKDTSAMDLLKHIRIPYIPYWSFGEKLPVIEKGTSDPEDIGFPLETLAALVAQKLSSTDILIQNRDSFVSIAKGGPTRIEAAEQDKLLEMENHEATTQSIELARQYATRGRYEEAESLYQQALVSQEKLGSDHPTIASILNNLADLYGAQGKYAEAELLYRRALEIREKALGPEHPDTARSLNYLANLYNSQGKYEQAEPLYQRALATYERVLEPDHPDTLAILNNLAALYQAQGKYEQAEPLYQRALATCERVLGPDHPNTLSNLNNLAALYQAQGKYAEAEPLYQRALATCERVLGPDHPNTLAILNNLAILYVDQGKYAEAEPLYQRALATCERVLGPDHPNTARSLSNLANLYADQGKYAEAEPLLQRALTIYEKVWGPEHPNTETVRENLKGFLRKRERQRGS
jgi:tetratricopeptide (TPR) repeat protein